MNLLATDWPECLAVIALSVTSGFSYLHESYGVAVIAGTCAGLIGGMQLAKWAMRR